MTVDATLVWFRQDLRLNDNPALYNATQSGQVLPVYILDTRHAGNHQPGAASNWWLHHSLESLNQSLSDNLVLLSGDPLEIIPELLATTGISSVTWNRCYEPWQIDRDTQLKEILKGDGIAVESYNANLLWEPWQILKPDQTPYKVFTPYYRKGCLTKSSPRMVLPKPESLDYFQPDIESYKLDDFGLLPDINWYKGMAETWQPGESGAATRLSTFLRNGLSNYKTDRNIPGVEGTSMLSPHMHFGEISPNQIWYAALGNSDNREEQNLDHFLSELGWREFSYYLLYHFPSLPVDNFQPKFDRFPWRDDPDQLAAWQQGQTGIPIVDAGMRELWQTGCMHNRVRMIVASFLVKNLLIHWHQGEAWFWDCLVDADLASNSASWQWVAGSGADAAPYFRIFNPVTQGQKFDPDGVYVKTYCPELSKLPNKYIHNPWEAPTELLQTCDITLGKEYPAPIADLKQTRQRALEAFKTLSNQQ